MVTLLSFFILNLCPSSLAETDRLIEVQWKEALLSVNAENALLAQILHEIASRTGLQVEGAERLQQLVSVHLLRVSLVEGLRDLLAGDDYAITGNLSSGLPPTRLIVFGPVVTHNKRID